MSNSANPTAEVAGARFKGAKVLGCDPVLSGTFTVSASTATTSSISSEEILDRLRAALQVCGAAESMHLAKLKELRLEREKLTKALAELGEPGDFVGTKKRAEALRDYMMHHPEEQVTTKSVKENPAKYGIVSASPRLQMNFLYATPSARRFFIVGNGIIKLRPA